VESLIKDYRIPVCSSTDAELGGYYLPRSADEAYAAIHHLESRAISLHERVSGFKQAVVATFGDQVSIFDHVGGND